LVEQGVSGTAADDVYGVDALAADLLKAFQNLLVFQRKAFERATDQSAFGIWDGLAGFFAKASNGSRHIGWIRKARIIGIDKRAQRRSRYGESHELCVFDLFAFGLERALALLDQPKTGNVFQ
jgi:hypothetical protein